MLEERRTLALAAVVAALLTGYMIHWAVSRPVDDGDRQPVPPLSWDEEPAPAPLVIGDELGELAIAAPLEFAEEAELMSLEPAPLEPAVPEPAVDDVFLAMGEFEPSAATDDNDLVGATSAKLPEPEAEQPVLWADGAASKSLRNADFPNTYIRHVEVDLASPDHWVRLTWTGPQAARHERGPFHSSPGAGLGNNNCNDMSESNRDGSNCTPKGEFTVDAFSDHMRTYRQCRFVTWFHIPRAIAFHSYSNVPNYPASHGCVRLDERAAQLIHNNSLMGNTKVTVGGTWTGR